MKKEKIHLEYLLNATSKNILWAAISTPTGLEDWFADKVVSDDKIVEFHWGKTEQRNAEIIAIRSFSFIRFIKAPRQYSPRRRASAAGSGRPVPFGRMT